MSAYPLRQPCRHCGCARGRIEARGGQDCVFCLDCDKFLYNAPRTETGKEQRTVTTIHNGIKPKQRTRILTRANFRCEFCGAADRILHVDHLIPVKVGLEEGLTDEQINSDDNLAASCEECNLGRAGDLLPLRSIVAIYLRRLKGASNA